MEDLKSSTVQSPKLKNWTYVKKFRNLDAKWSTNYNEIMSTINIFKLIGRGSSQDREQLEKTFKNDRRAKMYHHSDQNHIVNRNNEAGFRPLYVASQNGDREVK